MSLVKKSGNDSAGFTLIELVIVLAIIAIMASVATLTFNQATAKVQLQTAADRLITDLRLVRDQARRDQKPYTLQIHPASRTYQAIGVRDTDNTQDISVNLADFQFQVSTLLSQLNNGNSITFDDKGKPSSAGNILLSRGTSEITITISKAGKIEQVGVKE